MFGAKRSPLGPPPKKRSMWSRYWGMKKREWAFDAKTGLMLAIPETRVGRVMGSLTLGGQVSRARARAHKGVA
jgi:hypothetical protein